VSRSSVSAASSVALIWAYQAMGFSVEPVKAWVASPVRAAGWSSFPL
jgi:hypothetical protein